MLAELRLEREQIEEAILTLERLARGRGRRRGRPPGWLKDLGGGTNESGGSTTDENAARGLAFVQPPRRRGRPPGSGNKVKQMLAHAMEG